MQVDYVGGLLYVTIHLLVLPPHVLMLTSILPQKTSSFLIFSNFKTDMLIALRRLSEINCFACMQDISE